MSSTEDKKIAEFWRTHLAPIAAVLNRREVKLIDDAKTGSSWTEPDKEASDFENLTLAPIEKDLINFNLLNETEKNYLFKYHLNVYLKLSKFLNKKEKKWLASFI